MSKRSTVCKLIKERVVKCLQHLEGVVTLVSSSKTLNHSCFGLGRKAVGSVCCVMHVKEPSERIVSEGVRSGVPGKIGSMPQHLVKHCMVL